MPRFTIETTYRLPVYRQRAYDAETLEEACRLAVEDDDWSEQKEDYESSGETYVTGAWPGEDTAYRIAAGYDPSRPQETLGADAALLTLADPLTENGLPLGANARTGETIAVGGYNQDRVEIMEADVNCRLTGRAADASARPLLRHDCTATRGTSGAPVLEHDAKNVWRLIGINVAAFNGQIGGLSVPVETLRRLLQSGAR